jgi:putative toxin-antitoxin system antitoxin component (TIGR02293 family)
MKAKVRQYEIPETPLSMVSEDTGVYDVIGQLRRGIVFEAFWQIAQECIMTMQEWSEILHIDTRTLQRYKVQNLTFAPLQSEKILEIQILNSLGERVFGDRDNFNIWLDTKNVALGGSKPKELFDSTFGITLVKDELIRIQYGVLA